MKKKKTKESNFNFSLEIPDLGVNLKFEGHSEELQKAIDSHLSSQTKLRVIGSQSEFFDFAVDMWERNNLAFAEPSSFARYIEYLFDKVEVAQKKNSNKIMSLKSLKTMLYEYKNSR